MTPFVNDPDFQLHVGDALEVLQAMPAESVHCCVTSPPYWGLRDYGTGTWEGGDTEHTHDTVGARGGRGGSGTLDKRSADAMPDTFAAEVCSCGATRIDHQLGLEPTPDEYVTRMVNVFREVRRVLRADGTLWLNIGDSYAANVGGHASRAEAGADAVPSAWRGNLDDRKTTPVKHPTKPKDLVGIPWRLAFALQADGWYLRSDIIWSKPNPMPESVTDRPTKAHEYLFLLTKSPRYFYDADAIREPHAEKTLTHRGGGKAAGKVGQQDGMGKVASGNFGDWDKARTAYPAPRPQDETLDGSEGETPRGPDGRRITTVVGREGSEQHRNGERWPDPAGRNKRSVWEIATEAYPDAHFATFPQALVEPCVKAGTSEHGCCPECGAPWVRIVSDRTPPSRDTRTPGAHTPTGADKLSGAKMQEWLDANPRVTTGWRPSCKCRGASYSGLDRSGKTISASEPPEPIPGVVLDPFLGSGTTAQVARRLGRRSIGIELNPEYAQLAARRLQQLSLFAVETVEA